MSAELTRRALLGSVGSLASGALIAPKAQAGSNPPRLRLRMLETSDLHMFVLSWDYYRAKPDLTVGFASVANIIRATRAESVNTVLFDNGDLLQGNPLADFAARQPVPTAAAPHPIVAIMNSLNYDAATIGNHEFDYGLDFLEASLVGAQFPFVCANVVRSGGGAFLPPYRIITRQFKDTDGAAHEIRLGVIGFVTPQIMVWDKAQLDGKIEAMDILAAARRCIPELRKSCDLVVALSHSGIRGGEPVDGEENASLHLAAVPGIDVIMAGHQHRVFPGKDYAGITGADAIAGRLNGIPAVMPGFWGSHLGVIDLDLKKEAGRWIVEDAHVETRPIYARREHEIEELARPDLAAASLIAPLHERTLAWLEQTVGAIDAPIQSYFVWAGYDPASAIVNAAQIWHAKPLLAGAGLAGLPLLSAASPFRAGYTPDGFIDIAAGPVQLRQAAELYFFSGNALLVALKMTGAEVLECLEHAARIFNAVEAGAAGPQALINRRLPTYSFDIIAGLTYTVDVTKPSRYDTQGKLNAGNRRIFDVQYQGQPISLDHEFIVVTNNYFADADGHFPLSSAEKIILRAPDSNREAVRGYFAAAKTLRVPQDPPWTFAKIGKPTPVYFDTGKEAAAYLRRFPDIRDVGDGEPGYLRLGFTLS